MWHKMFAMLMIGTLLLRWPIDHNVAQSTSSSSGRALLMAHIADIAADGRASDMVKVIVTLRQPTVARTVGVDSFSMQQRAAAVRLLQQDFVGNQAGRMRVSARQPAFHPVVFGHMRREDIAILATESAVVGVQEDKPMPLLMNESMGIIGSAVANQAGYGGAGMTVAVLDTGVAKNHEFLSGQVVAEACFSNFWNDGTSLCPRGASTTNAVSNDVDSATPCVAYSGCDHGTHVAGIVAGKVIDKGSAVIRGVAPDAKIIGIQVFTYVPSKNAISSYSADHILAMDWLITHRSTPGWGTLAALNMSIGGSQYATNCDSDNTARKSYIDTLRGLNVATIISSGNDGWGDSISSPACISSAIAVGATTTSSALGYSGVTGVDHVAPFSNAPTTANNGINGNGDRLLDVLAPGFFIYSAVSSSSTSYDYKAGTSMAAPHVAGAWAIMKQIAPNASIAQILQWLSRTGTSITDTKNSLVLPRINVDDAVTLALSEPTPTNTATRTATRTPTRTTTRTPTRNPLTKPTAFTKSGPANALTNRPLTLTLSWAASVGATSYEYCFATSAAACTNWKSVATARSVTVRSLVRNRAYFWNVRAKNTAGTTVATGGVWKFTTIR